MSGQYTLNIRETAARPRSPRLRAYGIGNAGALSRVRKEAEEQRRGAYHRETWMDVRLRRSVLERESLRTDVTELQGTKSLMIVSDVEYYHEGTRTEKEEVPALPTKDDANGWSTTPGQWDVVWIFRRTTRGDGKVSDSTPRRFVRSDNGLYNALLTLDETVKGVNLTLGEKVTQVQVDQTVSTCLDQVVSWYHEATGEDGEGVPVARTANDNHGWQTDPGTWRIYWTYQETRRKNGTIVKTRVHRVVRSLSGVEAELETFREALRTAQKNSSELAGKVSVAEGVITTLRDENERLTLEAAPRLETVMTMTAERFTSLSFFDPMIADPRMRWSFVLCIVTGCTLAQGGGSSRSVPCVVAKACGPSGSGGGISGGAWSCLGTLYRLPASTKYTASRAIQIWHTPTGGASTSALIQPLADGVTMLFPTNLLESSSEVTELTDARNVTAAIYNLTSNVFRTRDGKVISFGATGGITVTEAVSSVSEETTAGKGGEQ